MKNKFTTALTSAVIMAMLLTSLALADTITPDADVVAANNQSSRNLGTVAPGAIITAPVSFTLVCAGNRHVDNGQTVNLSFSLGTSTVPAGGSLSATGASIGAIPSSWPDDGNTCPGTPPTPIEDNGNSTVTITAPMAGGTYTYNVAYSRDVSPPDITAGNTIATFTLTVLADSTPPVISYTVNGVFPAVPNGNNGWYTNNVVVDWTVTDPESSFSTTGCVDTTISSDTAGTTLSCSATSTGGTSSDSVTIQRDATAPAIDFVGPSTTPWYTTDVTANWSCTDALSGAVGASVSGTTSGEGNAQAATGTCTDNAGNTSSDTQNFMVDKTAPTITFTGPSTAAWYNADVTANWSCSDVVSGAVNASVSATTSGEGSAQAATGTCTDNAGNTSSDTQNFMVDKTDPTITFVGPSTASWYNADVTANWSCSDALSGAVSASVSGMTSGEGASVPAAGTCTDNAGNTSSDTQNFMVDKTAPTITFTGPSTALWYNADVTANWSCLDALSGAVSASVSGTTSGEGASVPAMGTCTDTAGNTSSDTQNFMVDKTTPTITLFSRLPAANGFGWNNTDVVVTWSCTDALSGPVAASVSDTKSGEGAGQSATGTCQDIAGNSASATQTNINIDKTAPSVSLVGGPANGGSYYFSFVPAAPTCTASDALSGLDGSCIVSGYGTAVGSHTVSASATDKAGNSASSASVSYTVLGWTIRGFYQPVDMNALNISRNGSTVPLKFEVFAGTTELTNINIVGTFIQGLTCGTGVVTDDIENYATGGTSLRYDTSGGQFIFNWQTPRLAGNCYRVTLTTLDGTSISADFKLK